MRNIILSVLFLFISSLAFAQNGGWYSGGVAPIMNPVAVTTSRSLTNADNGAILVSTSASAIILTVPTGLMSGFNVTAYQAGNGAISFTPAAQVGIADNANGTFGMNTSIGLLNTGTNTYVVETVFGGLPGTITNDNGAPGTIGELITATIASGSAVSLTTATPANVTSIVLTAGDWDISAQVDFALSGATSTLFTTAISLTSATLSTQPGGSGLGTDPLVIVPLATTTLTSTYGQVIKPVRLSIASTTTVYLVAQQSFSAGSSAAFGTIRARRLR